MDSQFIRYGFWLLGDAALKAAVILALGLGVAHSLRRSSAALRHLIVTVAIAAAMAMPIASAVAPRWNVTFLRLLPAPPVVAPSSSPARVADTAPALSPREVSAPSRRPDAGFSAPVVRTGSKAAVTPVAAAASPVSQAAPVVNQSQRVPSFALAVGLWILGAISLALRPVIAANRLQYLLRTSELVQESRWLHLLRQTMQGMGVERHVVLLQSCEVDVPIACGILYPALILPPDAMEWPEERRRMVLCHELAHVERRDALAHLAAELARALYWFNPLTWYACSYLRGQCERACDDRVLSLGAKASDYAHDLLEIASTSPFAPSYAGGLAMARRSQLEGRLLAVLNPKLDRSDVTRRSAAAICIATLALVLPLAAMRPQAAEPAFAQTQQGGSTVTASPLAPTSGISGGISGGVGKGIGGGVGKGVGGGVEGGVSGGVNTVSTSSYQESGTPPPAGFECLGDHGHRNMSTTSHDGHKSWVANWEGEGCSVDLRAEGDVTFNAESTQVTGISQGGYLEVNQRTGSNLRRLRITPAAGGALEYKLWINGQEQPFNDEARAWLASFLLALERQTGYNAPARVAALAQKGGPDAVIAEFANLGGDYVRARYLMEMLQTAQLTPQQVVRTINLTQSMGSDYEQARVLMTLAGKYNFNDEATRTAFLKSADNLKSDYEHARVLMTLLERKGVSPQNAPMALQSAAKIHSDYERARVLMKLSEEDLVSPSLQTAYLEALSSIDSDYERSRVLLGLMARQHLSDQGAGIALKAAVGIKSDYERARVLLALLAAGAVTPQRQPMFLEAASSISSDYERGRTLAGTARTLNLDDNGVLRLLNAAGGIHSENELANLLLVIAGKYPLRGAVRENYLKIANQIQSEYERNRALAAVATKAAM